MARRNNKQNEIYDKVKTMIFKNEFHSGDIISERELSEKFNTSRTPVREALKKLEYHGLVEIIPQKGAFVKSLSFDFILEIYELRLGLDPIAAYFCAIRHTQEIIDELNICMEKYFEAHKNQDYTLASQYNMDFHKTIAKGAKNRTLEEYEQNLINQCELYIQMNIIDVTHQENSLLQHSQILQHIINSNPDEAAAVAKEHVNQSIAYMLEMTRRYYCPK